MSPVAFHPVLVIKGIPYVLVPGQQGLDLEKKKPETGETEVTYRIRRQEGGSLECDCPGFTTWGHCKHTGCVQALHDLLRKS